VTIVQLSDLDDFLKDSLSIVRRGVANARNANQSNPALGIMADLPEKVDYEVMVVSNHQFLDRLTSTSSTDTNLINETSGSGELGSGGTLGSSFDSASSSSSESDAKKDSRDENASESSTSANTKTSTSERTSAESADESSTGTSSESEGSSSSGGGNSGSTEGGTNLSTSNENGTSLSNSNESGTKNDTRNSNNSSSESKTENNRSRQSGQTSEWNIHQVRGFDQKTGRWGGKNFAPVQPPTHTLKCS
jgi:hypothetical protein